jgi:hypothetical protein
MLDIKSLLYCYGKLFLMFPLLSTGIVTFELIRQFALLASYILPLKLVFIVVYEDYSFISFVSKDIEKAHAIAIFTTLLFFVAVCAMVFERLVNKNELRLIRLLEDHAPKMTFLFDGVFEKSLNRLFRSISDITVVAITGLIIGFLYYELLILILCFWLLVLYLAELRFFNLVFSVEADSLLSFFGGASLVLVFGFVAYDLSPEGDVNGLYLSIISLLLVRQFNSSLLHFFRLYRPIINSNHQLKLILDLVEDPSEIYKRSPANNRLICKANTKNSEFLLFLTRITGTYLTTDDLTILDTGCPGEISFVIGEDKKFLVKVFNPKAQKLYFKELRFIESVSLDKYSLELFGSFDFDGCGVLLYYLGEYSRPCRSSIKHLWIEVNSYLKKIDSNDFSNSLRLQHASLVDRMKLLDFDEMRALYKCHCYDYPSNSEIGTALAVLDSHELLMPKIPYNSIVQVDDNVKLLSFSGWSLEPKGFYSKELNIDSPIPSFEKLGDLEISALLLRYCEVDFINMDFHSGFTRLRVFCNNLRPYSKEI